MWSTAQVHGAAGANVCGTQTASWVEDVDSDFLQEQTQSICEELQRRRACTTLTLARHLGFEKSSAITSLMVLLLEKNVVVRVSDIPPIWSLSPTFPMSPHFVNNQFPLSHQPSSPVTSGFPPSCVAPPFQCSPILPTPVSGPISVPAPETPAPGPVATPTATPSPSPAPISNPTLVLPAPARIATPVVTVAPATSPVSTPISTRASVIPAPIATPTITPASFPFAIPSPAPTSISTPASVTPDPTPWPPLVPVPKPVSTPAATTPNPSQVPTPEFVVSRTSLTFLEHVIPVPEEDSEDEGEDAVADEKTSPKPLLPALTFTEHRIPETTEENKVSVVVNNPPDIKPRLPVPALTFKKHVVTTPAPLPPPSRAVVHEQKHEQDRNYQRNHSRGRKQENGQSYRYFQRPFKSEYQGSDTSRKKQKREKTGDHLTDLQVLILRHLREMGPTKTLDLTLRLGLVAVRDVNPSLYDLQKKNLVSKISDIPVVWQLYEPGLYRAEPEEDQGCSDSDKSW